MRFDIAYQAYSAQQQKSYGVITELTLQYGVCRSFVYLLLDKLKSTIPHLFSPQIPDGKISKKEIISKMILLRMIGQSSIAGISEIMKYDELEYSSVGSVSQSLAAIGALLPSVQVMPFDEKKEITVAADEIYIGNQPILITIEPRSSVILNIELSDDRKTDTWSAHFEKIETSETIKITKFVTDEGSGLKSAINDKSIDWQVDTYHSIAHRLGKWVHILERRAYKRIRIEYERKRVILSAKTPKIINKRKYQYNKSQKKTIEAIELYENFLYLYSYIIGQLKPFHSNGNLRDRACAEGNIEAALELIKSLKNDHINTQVISIEKNLPKLLNYFEEAKKAIENCKNLDMDDETITTLTIAWQWEKELIKAKKQDRKNRAKAEYLFYIEYAKDILGGDFEKLKIKLFEELDNIVQSSSMVENINSILRPYLDHSKNQITQEFLNLFAFWHNHRRYAAGKRKGKTPMEIFTKKKQNKDWIELLTDFIEKVDPSFFF